MTLFWRIFIWAAVVPVAFILYFQLKNECEPKKNIIVGVTLPYSARYDPEIRAMLERYKREMKGACWASLAAVVPCLFVGSVGAQIILMTIWIIALCVVLYLPYIRCNRDLQKLKTRRGWRQEEAPQAVTDLKAAAEEMRWLSPWWFLSPLLISLIPLLSDRTIWWLWALDGVLVPVFYLCYRYLYRSRSEVVDADSARTSALTRIRRYNWGKCWLILAWATGAFNVGLWLTLENVWLCMAVVLAYGLTACGVVAGVEFRVRRLQERLTADSGEGYYVDGDEQWIWGTFYYNPNDARLMVNARVGIGTTVNLARRSGQIITALGLALLLACPLLGVWLMGMERAPVELAVTETEITAAHYTSKWIVPLADIASAELVEELPRMARVAGTGLESACTGQFSADGWGRITCCIDPRTGPWLLVEVRDGGRYLFNASDPAATARAADALRDFS